MTAPSTPASRSSEPYRTLEVVRIAGALGAELRGLDLRQPLSDPQLTELRRAWLEHLVVFLHDQPLDADQYLAFARRIGEPIEYPFVKGLPEHPEIIEVKKLEHETSNFGGIWHSDTVYLERPPMASMLLAHEVPPYGGDTLFANMYLAYETLSEGLRRTLDSLVAVNSSAKADVSRTREERIKSDGRTQAQRTLLSEHPVVRTHPETGRKALYVNVAHTLCFKGWSEEESRPLLEYLHQHQVRVEHTCRFVWRPHSIAMWDNRCALHNPVNDYHGFRRVMHRISLAGDRPA